MPIRVFVSLLCAVFVCAGPAVGQTKKALAEREAFFATPKVLDISIDIDKTELEALRREPRKYAKATLKVGDKVYPNVGIHLKGAAGSYRGIDDKPGLTINMNKFEQPDFFFGMDKFHLSNSVQDPSYLSELLCGEMFRAAGVPASRISHATVTLNGRKRGLYYIKEGYDKYFLRDHFKDSDGNFYDGGFLRDIDQPLQLVSGRDDVKNRADLKALLAAAVEPNPQLRLSKLEKVLDIDKFVSYLVVESITWDWDGYPMQRNNYRIYHDKLRDKMVFIPSGMDQMFGDPNGPILPGYGGVAARTFVETPEGRKRFFARMSELHADVLKVDKLVKRLDELQAVVQPALAAVDENAGRDYPNQVNRLRNAIAQRSKSLEQQLKANYGGDQWILFEPPAEIFGGKEVELDGIRLFPDKGEGKLAGKLLWRRKGDAKFAELPLETVANRRFKVKVPASITQAPFEYYVEIQKEGGKPARRPQQGDQSPLLAIPDLTPPTAVPELGTSVLKNYRVTLVWKPATDDRKVVGYQVYRGEADRFPLNDKTLLAKVAGEALAYTDNKPGPKGPSVYAVKAVDVVGREGEAKYLRVEIPDHQPPENKVAVQALPSAKSVLVAWTGELEPIVAAMEIQRGEGKDGPLTKIAEVTDLKAARYVDKNVKLGVEYRYAIRPRSTAGLAGEASKNVSAAPLRSLKRINCGGPEIMGADGVPWEADVGSGHSALKYSGSRIWSAEGDVSKDIYKTERWAGGGLGYKFKLDPGRYEIVLHFAETNPTFAGKGKRVFDIEFNGKKVAEKVDVFAEAKGQGKPWQFCKEMDLADGALEIKLLANPTGPAIKGIEIRGLVAK